MVLNIQKQNHAVSSNKEETYALGKNNTEDIVMLQKL